MKGYWIVALIYAGGLFITLGWIYVLLRLMAAVLLWGF